MTLIEQIIKDEGFRSTAYRCPVGRLTIGYGRNIESKGITKAEAMMLLRQDIAECESDMVRLFGMEFWDDLGDVRRNALVNMRFQLGGRGIRGFKKAIWAIKQRDWRRAGAEILDSRYARQVPGRAQRIAYEITDGIAG